MSSPARVAAVLCLVLVGGCGGEAGENPDPQSGVHALSGLVPRAAGETVAAWHAGLDEGMWRLPESLLGGPDRAGAIQRLCLDVLPSGDVEFKGNVWRLSTGGEPGRKDALIAVRNELLRLTDDPRLRSVDGTSFIRVMVNASRRAAWSAVRPLLRIARDPHINVSTVQLGVSAPGDHRTWLRQDVRLADIPSDADLAEFPTLRLESRMDPDGAAIVQVSAGDRTWTLATGVDLVLDESALAHANASWREACLVLHDEARWRAAVTLSISGDPQHLPWGFVLTAMDVLRDAGCVEVALEDAGLLLRFDPLAPYEVGADR